MQKIRLGDLLILEGLLTESQLSAALAEHKKLGKKLGEYLVEQHIVQEEQIIGAISRQLQIPVYTPTRYPVDHSNADLISAETSQKYKVIGLAEKGNVLITAIVDPTDINALDAVEIETNKEVEPVICALRDFEQLQSTIYGTWNDLGEVMDDMSELDLAQQKDSIQESNDLQVTSLHDMAQEAPVIRLVNSILSQAIKEGASDVHISPEKNFVQLRFRIDGRLQEVPSPPKSMFMAIASRFKILANMDIATTRVPQDGRFTISMNKREINVRAFVLPTIYGENVVLRLLDMSSGGLTLPQLGINAHDLALLQQIIHKPYGMILSTGPTGSGKSTSLYAILRELNQPDINIITLEDPVEYRLQNIRQVQLNTKVGMTFASGLRSILRQDPDVVMLGEIRDQETAKIAVQTAMTGHRLLSTVHTNDSAGAITRFIEMGIEPFLISSVLLCSVAQRLIRKVCQYCREPYTPEQSYIDFWQISPEKLKTAKFMRGKGCTFCNNTGYQGRIGLYELLINDEQVQKMTLEERSAQEITRALVAEKKIRLLREDAEEKILEGTTTIEEATSVVIV